MRVQVNNCIFGIRVFGSPFWEKANSLFATYKENAPGDYYSTVAVHLTVYFYLWWRVQVTVLYGTYSTYGSYVRTATTTTVQVFFLAYDVKVRHCTYDTTEFDSTVHLVRPGKYYYECLYFKKWRQLNLILQYEFNSAVR